MKAVIRLLDQIDGHTPRPFQIGFRLFLIGAGASIRSTLLASAALQDQLAEDIRLLNEKIAAFDKLENPK